MSKTSAMNGDAVSRALSLVEGRTIRMLAVCGVIALLAPGCSGDEVGGVRSEPTAEVSTGTSTGTATPTEDAEEALTPEETEWLGMASTVGPGFVSQALDAIARDRDDEGAFFASTELEGGSIEDALPEEAPGRFADAHAPLLAAREELAAFRTEGESRADTGTEYDALLAGYEEAVIEWAAVVGVEVP